MLPSDVFVRSAVWPAMWRPLKSAAIKSTLDAIIQQQAVIKAANKRLGELREALANITIEPVSATDVLGVE